jgi:hypothetical protein
VLAAPAVVGVPATLNAGEGGCGGAAAVNAFTVDDGGGGGGAAAVDRAVANFRRSFTTLSCPVAAAPHSASCSL